MQKKPELLTLVILMFSVLLSELSESMWISLMDSLIISNLNSQTSQTKLVMDSASEAKEKVVKDFLFHSIKHSLDHENIILWAVFLLNHSLKPLGKDFLSSIFREHFKPQSDQSQFHEGSKDQGIDFYELLEELTLL